MPTITAQDRNNISRIIRKVREDIAPAVDRAMRGSSLPPDDGRTLSMMTAQNTLRVCMEVVLNESLPYDQLFCAELAVRLAAYAITVAPIEDHDALVRAVQGALPGAVETKRREGAIIRTSWMTDGAERPNVPDPGQVQ